MLGSISRAEKIFNAGQETGPEEDGIRFPQSTTIQRGLEASAYVLVVVRDSDWTADLSLRQDAN